VFALWTGRILPFFLGSAFGEAVASYPSLLVNISGTTLMRASALFPDPHMLSLYLGLSIPPAAAFWLQSGKRKRRMISAALILLISADLLTFSRGGYFGLFVGLGGFFILFFGRRLTLGNFKPVLLGSMVFLIATGLLLATPFGTRLLSSFSLEDGSNTERLRLWQEAVGYIGERPLLGAGIGNYPLLAKPSASYREPIYAHNLYLDIASEIGLLGALCFAGLLFLSLCRAWRKWRAEQDVFALAILCSLIIFSTHSLFELPLFPSRYSPPFFS
jgi:O-antigen ligase